MAKHLNKKDIEAIVNIIHAFDGSKLTWKWICKASEPKVGKKPTRQSLSANSLIKDAFDAKKAALKLKVPDKPRPSSLTAAADRIARLESELHAQKRKNSGLLEQFVVWQYNAYKHGLDESKLNAPLPRIDRERTEC